MAGGRPRTFTDDEVLDLVERFEDYIATTEIPIIAEFAYQNDVPRDILYDYDEFSTLRKKAIDKKEAQLERLGLSNQVDKTMAIFSLKQLGWRDKQDIEHSGELDSNIRIEVVGADG